MDFPELRTAVLSDILVTAACAAAITFVWLRNRRRFSGLGNWAAAYFMFFAAVLVTSLGSTSPNVLIITTSDALYIGVGISLLGGLERFLNQRGSQVHNLAILAAATILNAYLISAHPETKAHIAVVSAALALVFFQGAWLVFRRANPEMRSSARGVGVLFAIACLINLSRVIVFLMAPSGNEYIRSSAYQALQLILSEVVVIGFTFGLLLIVNRRLILENELELANREKAEESERKSESRYLSLFENMLEGYAHCKVIYDDAGSPQDFVYLHVNDTFEEQTGLKDVVGKRVTELIPDIRASNPELFEIYGRVASTGVPEKFETHLASRPTEGWYSVSVFSPEQGHFIAVFENITTRRQTEEALQSSESLFHQMFSEHSSIKVLVDPENGNVVDANPAASRFYGYPIEILRRMNLQQIDAAPPDEITHTLHDALEKRRNYFTFQHRLASGELRSVEIYAAPIQMNGEPLLHFIVHDITERKRMEEALQSRNNMLATLQQTMFDLVDRHEVDDILQTLLLKIGSLLDAQQVSIDILEDDELVTRAATPGQPLQIGDRMRHGEGGWLSWQAIETGKPQVLEDYATWSQRRDLYEGYPIHAIVIVPIHQRERVIGTINFSREEPDKPFSQTEIYAAQQLAQMVALVLDNANLYTQLRHELAERKQIQEVLRISQENYRTYFNMGTGKAVTSVEKGWIEVNDILCDMLGYSAEEIKGFTWNQLTHPDDLTADEALFDQVLRGEIDSYHLDKRFLRKDGSVLYASMNVSCQRYPDRSVRYFMASVLDITERIQQEQALEQAQVQLLEQQRSLAVIEERQRLARDLHDSVSQSIHSLVLFSETLTSMLEKKNSERALQISERLQESARQALKETRLMLYQLQPSELEVGREIDLAHEIEARLSSVEERAGVRVSLQIVGDAYLYPSAWRENLFRITIEALNNSLKHAQARRVRVVFHCSESAVVLTIQDDGIGFDVRHARTGGMGLHTMRERAELLGGQLEIASTPGKGTRVVFRAEGRKAYEAHPNPDR